MTTGPADHLFSEEDERNYKKRKVLPEQVTEITKLNGNLGNNHRYQDLLDLFDATENTLTAFQAESIINMLYGEGGLHANQTSP